MAKLQDRALDRASDVKPYIERAFKDERVREDVKSAIMQLVEEAGLSRALYAGDDTTDLDAFRALDGLELGVRVAVSSDEAPSELVGAADIVVDSPAELLALLARL